MERKNKEKVVVISIGILIIFVIGAALFCVISLCSFYSNRYVWLGVGDSITYGEGDNGRSYIDYIEKKHNDIDTEKKAVGGMKTAELVLYSNNGFLDIEKEPDLVTVLMGTNDFGMDVTIEEYEHNLDELICTLKGLFPNTKIVLLTPLYRDYFGERTVIIPGTINHNGNTLYEYIDLIKKKGAENGITVVELDEKDYLNENNLREYTVDGLHLNRKGNMLVADKLYDAIIVSR